MRSINGRSVTCSSARSSGRANLRNSVTTWAKSRVCSRIFSPCSRRSVQVLFAADHLRIPQMWPTRFLNSCAMPAESLAQRGKILLHVDLFLQAASSVKSLSRADGAVTSLEPRRMAKSSRPIAAIVRGCHVFDLFTAECAALFEAAAMSCTAQNFAQHFAVPPEGRASSQSHLGGRIRAGHEARRINSSRPARHIVSHGLAQALVCARVSRRPRCRARALFSWSRVFE